MYAFPSRARTDNTANVMSTAFKVTKILQMDSSECKL